MIEPHTDFPHDDIDARLGFREPGALDRKPPVRPTPVGPTPDAETVADLLVWLDADNPRQSAPVTVFKAKLLSAIGRGSSQTLESLALSAGIDRRTASKIVGRLESQTRLRIDRRRWVIVGN